LFTSQRRTPATIITIKTVKSDIVFVLSIYQR
jgi:hypothetical protein